MRSQPGRVSMTVLSTPGPSVSTKAGSNPSPFPFRSVTPFSTSTARGRLVWRYSSAITLPPKSVAPHRSVMIATRQAAPGAAPAPPRCVLGRMNHAASVPQKPSQHSQPRSIRTDRGTRCHQRATESTKSVPPVRSKELFTPARARDRLCSRSESPGMNRSARTYAAIARPMSPDSM